MNDIEKAQTRLLTDKERDAVETCACEAEHDARLFGCEVAKAHADTLRAFLARCALSTTSGGAAQNKTDGDVE